MRVSSAEVLAETLPGESGAGGFKSMMLDAAAEIGIGKSGCDLTDECLCGVGDQDVPIVLQRKPLSSDGGGNHGRANSERLDNLEASSAADPERNNLQPGAAVKRAHIWNRASHGHAGFVRQLTDLVDGILSDDQEMEVGKSSMQRFMDFAEVPTNGVDVRIVIHGAAEDQRGPVRSLFGWDGVAVEVIKIDAVWNNGDGNVSMNPRSHELFVVGSAQDLECGAAGNGAFVEPEFRDVFPVQNLRAKWEVHPAAFHQLILEIDARAVGDKRNVEVFFEKILTEHDIAEMNDVVARGGEEAAQTEFQLRQCPMRDRCRQWIQQTCWKEFLPIGMSKRNEFNGRAEVGKYGFMFGADALFRQGDQVDFVLARQGAE